MAPTKMSELLHCGMVETEESSRGELDQIGAVVLFCLRFREKKNKNLKTTTKA